MEKKWKASSFGVRFPTSPQTRCTTLIFPGVRDPGRALGSAGEYRMGRTAMIGIDPDKLDKFALSQFTSIRARLRGEIIVFLHVFLHVDDRCALRRELFRDGRCRSFRRYSFGGADTTVLLHDLIGTRARPFHFERELVQIGQFATARRIFAHASYSHDGGHQSAGHRPRSRGIAESHIFILNNTYAYNTHYSILSTLFYFPRFHSSSRSVRGSFFPRIRVVWRISLVRRAPRHRRAPPRRDSDRPAAAR
jgi:hypothetical protein